MVYSSLHDRPPSRDKTIKLQPVTRRCQAQTAPDRRAMTQSRNHAKFEFSRPIEHDGESAFLDTCFDRGFYAAR
jgi:hypothetical protein